MATETRTGQTQRGAAAGEALLEARDVSVVYHAAGQRAVSAGRRAQPALSGFSADVRAGEVVGLVGPNGSGKTTFVRAVTGAVKLASGRLTIAGDDVSALSAVELARRIAVVPQTPHLPESFSALECVLMGRTPHLRLLENESASDVEIARQAMLATGTWDVAARPVGELSGGERQRVVIARALAQQAPVLLLDEPTAHLDIGHQASVLEMARGLAAGGKAVLAIVHDLTLAAQYCDRLIMLHRGETVARGDPADVIEPAILRRVYGSDALVFPHPQTGRPIVVPGG